MTYKDKEQAKVAARIRQQKHRQGVTKGVTLEGVTEQGVTALPREWQHIKDYISREVPDTEPNKMPYLERLQRIAGSLGHNAGEVWFGGLTVGDIAETIGVLPPRY